NTEKIQQLDSRAMRYPGASVSNSTNLIPYRMIAKPAYNHLHFKTVCQKVLPLYTKRKPKKKARNPFKKPCQVWAYNANSWGFINKTSVTKNKEINKGAPGWPMRAEN